MYRLGLLLLICAVIPVQAAILWMQLPDTAAVSLVDQEFPDLAAYSSYQLHDVTVGAGGWNITSITGYYNIGSWPATADVRINIFPKTGPLPGGGDDPTAGSVYSASLTNDGLSTLVTAGGLSINLAPGDYWIGMTPTISFNDYGQQYHQQALAMLGDPSAVRNPGGGFGFGTDWVTYAALGYDPNDGAILIEGDADIPEPGTWSLLALGIGALALLRRRR